jgi:hypothetical protein
MNHRLWVSSVAMAAALAIPAFVAAQSKPAAKPAETAKNWKMPRTPEGVPDLQGYYTTLSFTPMERPAKFGGREFLTDEEAKKISTDGLQQSYEFTFGNYGDTPVYDATVYGLSAWQEGVAPNRRSSLVVDPPDGKIPAMTPAGEKARDLARVAGAKQSYADPNAKVVADTADDLNLGERCLTFGGPPILPTAYNSNWQIVQGTGVVIIENEWGNEIRTIPTDGSAHPSANLRFWHGDSRGHWEGDTLVVDTTNFRPESTYLGANSDTFKLTERFTRTDQNTIEYKFTINDPSTWTKPWSAIVPLSHIAGPIFEYACTENNDDAVNILAGARASEREKAMKGTPVSEK